jgi:hypothetical protein
VNYGKGFSGKDPQIHEVDVGTDDQVSQDFKYSLDGHINGLVFEFFDGNMKVLAMKDRKRILASLSVTLDTIRYYSRLCSDMKLISLNQYKFTAESMGEFGKLLGGWMGKA